MVYTGLFPIDNKDYENLRDALDKLHVNDPSLVWEPETSVALGFGFRVGFLGLLHMEVVKERLEREFNLDLIATSPSVDYHVYKTDGEMIDVRSPQDLPEATRIERIEEPYLKAKIICPPEYTGAVMQLAIEHRGITTDMIHLTSKSVEMRFDMPLAELILDFFDQLKSRTKGYASLDYEFNEYRPSELVKLDILLSGDEVDALSFIVHKDKAYGLARGLCDKLKEIIPRQLFECLFRRHRQQDHCPLYRQGASQGRFGQVLWRRYLAKAQAAREAERGQEAHEGHRFGRGPAGGLYGDPKGRRVSPWRFLNTASVCWAPMPSSRSLWLPWRA